MRTRTEEALRHGATSRCGSVMAVPLPTTLRLLPSRKPGHFTVFPALAFMSSLGGKWYESCKWWIENVELTTKFSMLDQSMLIAAPEQDCVVSVGTGDPPPRQLRDGMGLNSKILC